MVGEQESRKSGTGGSGTASVPQSYRWKRIQNMNARSRLQEVSGSLNCAEKFSSLVSCHRGYGSVAFYAVFSLFILTFLYTIWKIVSAHTRSARRPGSSNSTSPTVSHTPTGYSSGREWIKTENILDHFHQSVKKLRPFPQRKPSPTVYYPSENTKRVKISSVHNNVDFPTRENPSPTWPSSGGATKGFYNYYPGSFNTVQPPVTYLSFPRGPYPRGPVRSSTLPYPTAFNPYLRLPFPGGVNSNQRLPSGAEASNLLPYNGNSMGIFNENESPSSSSMENISYRAPYNFPTNKNTFPQSFYNKAYYGDNAYYRDNAFQNADAGAKTSPSPLISFLTESSHDARKSRHHFKQSGRKRKKSGRKVTKHGKKKRNHFRKPIEYEYIENIEKKNNRNGKSTRHHKVNGNRKAFKHLRKKYHENKISHDHHYDKTTGNTKLRLHLRKYKRTHISKNAHAQHQARNNLKVHKKIPFISQKYKRTNIPHRQKTTQASYLKPSFQKHHIQHFRHQKHFGAHHVPHRRHHNFFNFRLYRRYRKHHTVNDEIHGRWKISRHRVRTCKLISQFSTGGTVKITRASGHNRRFLHTLLICRPVRLRVRRGQHQRRYSLKYAQLCNKKWYVTKGVIYVHKTSNDQDEIPRYSVGICEPSYAHAMKLVPTEGKDTKVWSISKQFVRKMEKEDAKKFNVKMSSKNVHRHNHREGKLIHHKRKNKVKERETGVMNNKRRGGHHTHKTATHKRNHHHESKAAHHDNKYIKQHKLKKSYDHKSTKHDRKKKLVSGNKKKDSNGKTKGPVVDSDKLFYRKLLKVFKLAKMRDRKKANLTTSNDVFDSLEAVLVQSQSETKRSSQSKNHTKTELNVKKNKNTKQKASQKDSPKHAQRMQEKSNNNTIQKLLAKILPAVVGIINGDAGASAITMVTTKPTKSTSTQKTSTSTTPTSQIPSMKTKTNDNNMEDIMKNILPLLLKRAGKVQGNVRLKSEPKEHKRRRPISPKQRTSQPKRTTDKSGLTSILASLGLGNLASNSLRNTISAKETVATNKPVVKPTQRSTIALKTTLLPKIPVQPPITRSIPTPPVTTIQAPPSSTQPHAPLVQSISSPAISQISPVGLSPGRLSAPPSVQLPAAQQGSSTISSPMSPLQPAVSPQGIHSDPYSRSILCFGDSLTSGYYNHGHNFHPYSQRLSQLLNSEGRLKYYVKSSGKVREMAHGSMARRLPEVLGNSSRFDWVIILGGTNDAAHVKNFGDDDSFMNQLISIWKPRIVRDIEVLHEIAHSYGARTVLLTIPETAYEAWPNYKTLWVMRNRINEDLRDYARRSQGNVVLCDLANQMPRHSLSLQAQSILWSDHLHLTPYGYDKMAEIVYQCLKPYLNS